MKTKLSLVLVALLTACGGGGSSSTPSTPVAPVPVIQISSSATKAFKGDEVKISWSTVNTTNCTGQDSLPNAAQPITGSYNASLAKSGEIKFTLTCTGAGGQSTNTVVLDVQEPIQTFSANIASTNTSGPIVISDYTVTKGIFTLNTGVWGRSSGTYYNGALAGAADVKNSVLSSAEFLWDTASSSTPGIVAFNNVTVGKHPGWLLSTFEKFPVQIGNIQSVKVTGDIKTVCMTACQFVSGSYAYITSQNNPIPSWVENPPLNSATEIIVNSEASHAPWLQDPSYIGKTIVGGIEYHVFAFVFPSNWRMVTYRPVIPGSGLNLDLKDFIQDTVNRGYVKTTDYLMSFEVGVEMASGKGKTTITNLKVN